MWKKFNETQHNGKQPNERIKSKIAYFGLKQSLRVFFEQQLMQTNRTS